MILNRIRLDIDHTLYYSDYSVPYSEQSKWLQEKQIDIRTYFNNQSHTRICKIEKPINNTTIHRLLKIL